MPFRKKYWYWNIETRRPEFGRVSRTEQLLGPYRSREEAEQAPRIIAERNAQWIGQERAAAAQAAREKADRDPDAARRKAEKAAADTSHPSSTHPADGHDRGRSRTRAADAAPLHGHGTDKDGAVDRRNDNNQEAGDTSDDWPSWKDFLEEPSAQELERERREGAGAPPAFFGDTSAIGVVGDDENGTFEQRVQRFNKDRSDFERQARQDEQARKARERRSAQEADRAIADNERQARRLLEQQERDLPGRVSRSLHVWQENPTKDQVDSHTGAGGRTDPDDGLSDNSDTSTSTGNDTGTGNHRNSTDHATGEGR